MRDTPLGPGMRLSLRLYETVIAPTMARAFPQMAHAAGRLDGGSEVLGFETPLSQDHGWGPKVTVFVAEGIDPDAVYATLAAALPDTIDGAPTRFPQPTAGSPEAYGDGVWVTTIPAFFRGALGCDPTGGMTTADWLAAPVHRLRALAAGQLWHDGGTGLTEARETLAWYPEPLWRALLATQWRRIAEEEAFLGRCGDVGDELGSRLIAARQARELMRLVFLLARTYPPYAKWFGTAFAQLPAAATVAPLLERTLRADDWRAREAALCEAYTAVARIQNALRLGPEVDPSCRSYYDRPYQVLDAGRLAAALGPTEPIGLGAAWQWTDDVGIDEHPDRARAAAASVGRF